MRFIDFFSGIGGFRLGLKQAGGYKPVGWVEIDKFARKSYEVMYNVKDEWTARDIRKVKPKELPETEIYTAGFPCQSFSIAGKRGGFEDTRGTLFFEIARLARERKPKYLLLENVKGLLNHDGGQTFSTILNTLEELGYWWEYQVLNSKDFGVPQNRERVFIVGHLRGESSRKVFPIRRKNKASIRRYQADLSGKGYNSQQDRIHETDGLMCCLPAGNERGEKTKIIQKGLNTTKEGNSYAITTRTHANYDYKGAVEKSQATLVKACLTPERINKRQNGRRFKNEDEPMFTLTGQDIHGVKQDMRIRKLTPRECWRLQGFPDELFEKAAEVNSDSQLYKQAGNSVTVNVIEEIGRRLS